MPKYYYKAISNGSDVTEGEIEAPSQSIAIERLQSSGYMPISAEEIGDAKQSVLFKSWFQRNKISHQAVIHLTRELATLMNAGLPMDQALMNLSNLTKQPDQKKMLQDILAKVEGGATFSEALEAQGKTFSPLYISMVRAGEAGGALDAVLSRLSEFMEKNQALRASTISALIYPTILFCVAMLSVFILLMFVVPQFVPLFEDSGKALPLLTDIVFSCAEVLKQFWWLPLCLFIIAALAFEQAMKAPENKLAFDKWLLRLPLFGDLISKLEVARFARTLGTLLNNGVPLLQSVDIVRDVLSNTALAAIMQQAHAGLERGEKFAALLKEDEQFPELAVQLIHVGEDSGQLEPMLLKIADIYEDESARNISRLLSLLEPAMILGLGLIIAVIILSILMAMLGLNELVI